MLKSAMVGLGRGGAGCVRGQTRNLREGKLRGVLEGRLTGVLEGRLRGICPIENIRTLSTSVSKKNMALEVREELRKKASPTHTSCTASDI